MKLKYTLTIALLFSALVASAQKIGLVIPKSHADGIEATASTPDGRLVASLAKKTLMIWDVASNKKIHEFEVSSGEKTTISLSADGNRVLLGGRDGLYYMDTQTGQQLFKLNGGASYGSMLSADGGKAYSYDSGYLSIYSTSTGKQEKQIYGLSDLYDAKLYPLPGNKILVLANNGWYKVDPTTDAKEVSVKIKRGIREDILDVNFSPADNIVVYTFKDNGEGTFVLKTFDATTGNLILNKTLAAANYSPIVSINNSGEIIMLAQDLKANAVLTEVIKVNGLQTVKKSSSAMPLQGLSSWYNGQLLPMPNSDKVLFSVYKYLWFYNKQSGEYTKGFEDRVADFRFNFYYPRQNLMADNQFRVVTDEGGLRNFNLETLKPAGFTKVPESAVFSADGKLVAGITPKKITVSEVATGKVIRLLPAPANVDIEFQLFFFSADNKLLIHTNKDKKYISAINIATGVDALFKQFAEVPYKNVVTLDGKYFACVNFIQNRTHLIILNTQTKAVAADILMPDASKTNDAADDLLFVGESHKLLVTAQSLKNRVYDADKPAVAPIIFNTPHDQIVFLGADIKNNLMVLANKLNRYKPAMYSLDGKLIKELAIREVFKVAFTADAKLMFAANKQKGVEVWRVENNELLGTYYFISGLNEYIFVSPENLFDGSVAGMKELYFVRNNKPIPLENLYERFYTPNLLQRKIAGERFSPPNLSDLHEPPVVRITYAQATRNLKVVEERTPAYANTTGVAEITVNASAENDKIDEIRLFHNGKIVNLATRGLFVTDNTTGTDTKKYTLNLLPGANNIRAVALNSQRTESEPDEILVNYNSGAQANTPPVLNNGATGPVATVDKDATMHLVVVGINAYKNPKMSLNYALADATAFKNEAEKDAKTITTNLKTYFVTDAQADKNGITAAFAEVQKNAKPQDVFVFYYA
ncbi:WD40 repeat domain-containing protein, partial [Mucilaginibacter pedocola]|uniref:WD40 repeat domain-containing protein n=1 Tax=Mucilaginibacter pedocola TaxID=1792845 RepID=UPI00117D19AA